MTDETRRRPRNDRDTDRPLHAVDAVRIAPRYVIAAIDHQPTQITGVEPTDEGGWIVEAEVVEDRRIPSTADMLALYEIELDANGELLAYRRTRRYMRGQRWLSELGAEQPNGDMNGDGLNTFDGN
jgi:gas vesicle protein GvpO